MRRLVRNASEQYRSYGQGPNSQFGPVRPTAEPSGQILASCVQITGEPGAAWFGHAANSQLGPCRPTADPSGHIFASSVHETGALGHAANSQLGPVRLTLEPSAHIFASAGHATGASPGHGANSQLGPLRATADPSGQTLASSVQAAGGGVGGGCGGTQAKRERAVSARQTLYMAAVYQMFSEERFRAIRLHRSRCQTGHLLRYLHRNSQ